MGVAVRLVDPVETERRGPARVAPVVKVARPKPAAGVIVAVARCVDCGLDLGQTPITDWERAHLPTSPWGRLVALAEAHRAAGCDPLATISVEATAVERLRAIEACVRRSSTDCGGLMALGSHVRALVPVDGLGGVR